MYLGETLLPTRKPSRCAGAYGSGPSPTWQAVSSKAKEKDTFQVQRKKSFGLWFQGQSQIPTASYHNKRHSPITPKCLASLGLVS